MNKLQMEREGVEGEGGGGRGCKINHMHQVFTMSSSFLRSLHLPRSVDAMSSPVSLESAGKCTAAYFPSSLTTVPRQLMFWSSMNTTSFNDHTSSSSEQSSEYFLFVPV